MAVSKRLRFEILRRDNHTCRYCGRSAPEVVLRVDHVLAVALGGSDDPSNLVAACEDCNSGKASTSPGEILVADVKQDDLRWAAAIKRAMAAQSEAEKPRRDYVQHFDHLWSSWCYGAADDPKPLPRQAGWESSVGRFFDAGVPMDKIAELIVVAARSRVGPDGVWRYFCGCVWRYLDQIHTAAKQLLDADQVDGGDHDGR